MKQVENGENQFTSNSFSHLPPIWLN